MLSTTINGIQFNVGDLVRLPALEEAGIPEQRAHILEIYDVDFAMFRVIDEDIVEYEDFQPDGLVEASFDGVEINVD